MIRRVEMETEAGVSSEDKMEILVKTESSEEFVDAVEYLSVEMESEEFVDTVEYLSVEMETRGQKHTNGSKGHPFDDAKPSTSAFVPPHTSSQEPAGRESPEISGLYVEMRVSPDCFESLYEVGKRLKYNRCVHEGVRREDGKKVFIKFVPRRQPKETSELPEILREQVTRILALQRTPASEHIVKFDDRFVLKNKEILIMEHPHPAVNMTEFIKGKRGHLTEGMVKDIMRQLSIAMHHCWDRGVYYLSKDQLFIDPDTLKIKVMNWCKQQNGHERDAFPLNRLFFIIMKALIKAVRRPFWDGKPLSRGCLNTLRRLETNAMRPNCNLGSIFCDPWFTERHM